MCVGSSDGFLQCVCVLVRAAASLLIAFSERKGEESRDEPMWRVDRGHFDAIF